MKERKEESSALWQLDQTFVPALGGSEYSAIPARPGGGWICRAGFYCGYLGWPRPLLSGSRAPRTPMETPRDPCCRALQTAYGPGAIIRWHRLEVLTIHDYFSATFHGVVI